MKRPCTPLFAWRKPFKKSTLWRASDGTPRQLLRLDAGQIPALSSHYHVDQLSDEHHFFEFSMIPPSEIWDEFGSDLGFIEDVPGELCLKSGAQGDNFGGCFSLACR
jgi:hypothetical protein